MPRATWIVLACVAAAGCGGAAGPKVTTQAKLASQLGCPARARLPDPPYGGRPFPGTQEVRLPVPTGALIVRGTLASAIGDLAVDDGHVWVTVPAQRAVLGLDPHRRRVTTRIPLGLTPLYAATGGGKLWVAARRKEGDPASLVRVDADTGEVSGHARLGPYPTNVAYGGGAVWLGDSDHRLYRVDAGTLAVQTFDLPSQPYAVAAVDGRVWVATESGFLYGYDAATGRPRSRIRLGGRCEPSALALSGHVLYVAESLLDAVVPVDLANGRAGAAIPVGDGPAHLAADGGRVWVSDTYSSAVSRVDPERRRVTGTFDAGIGPGAIAVSDAGVWVLDFALDRLTYLPIAT